MQTFLFIVIIWFIHIEGMFTEMDTTGEKFLGIRRDGFYDFRLPADVIEKVQDETCDADWTIDNKYGAFLDGNSRNFSLPFQNVTRRGITTTYCPVLVTYHVSCKNYAKKLEFFCTNVTDNYPQGNSTLPRGTNVTDNYPQGNSTLPRDTDPSGRNHYCAIAFSLVLCIILVILVVLYITKRTKSNAPAGTSRR